jgi:DNA-binding XRE family transcriptional regulator
MTPAEAIAAAHPPRAKVRDFGRAWHCAVREHRRRLRMSLTTAAEAIGISLAQLSKIERGSDLRLTTATAIANFFGQTIEALWVRRDTSSS